MCPRNPRPGRRGGAAPVFRHHGGGGRTLWICTDRRNHARRRATVRIGFRFTRLHRSSWFFCLLLAGIACGESHGYISRVGRKFLESLRPIYGCDLVCVKYVYVGCHVQAHRRRAVDIRRTKSGAVNIRDCNFVNLAKSS